MNSTRIQVAAIAAIAALGFAGAAVADDATVVKSRIYTEAQDWTGGGAPDSAFKKSGVLKSRQFDTVANDSVGGPAPAQGTKAVRTLSWDNAPAWTAREGGPTVAPVSQITGSKHASN
jgi:hypothetical protein